MKQALLLFTSTLIFKEHDILPQLIIDTDGADDIIVKIHELSGFTFK